MILFFLPRKLVEVVECLFQKQYINTILENWDHYAVLKHIGVGGGPPKLHKRGEGREKAHLLTVFTVRLLLPVAFIKG